MLMQGLRAVLSDVCEQVHAIQWETHHHGLILPLSVAYGKCGVWTVLCSTFQLPQHMHLPA